MTEGSKRGAGVVGVVLDRTVDMLLSILVCRQAVSITFLNACTCTRLAGTPSGGRQNLQLASISLLISFLTVALFPVGH